MGAFHKAGLPDEKIKLVGAFCERPRANAVRPYGKKDRGRKILCPFSHALPFRLVCYTF